MAKEITITTAENMVQLGYDLCRKCKGGEVFVLSSDLGGGKTTLVRGMARAIGEEDSVSSPSFTLQNTYQSKNMTIEHFDFYRLDNPGIMSYELEEAVRQKNTIVAIEWPGIVMDSIPENSITITIRIGAHDERNVVIDCPKSLNYILEGVSV